MSSPVARGLSVLAGALAIAGGAAWWGLMSGGDVVLESPPHWQSRMRLLDAESHTIVTDDSVTLRTTQQYVPSRGTLVVVHGLGPHDRAVATMVDALGARVTYHVLGLTLRGQPDGMLAMHPGASRTAYERDLAAVVHELKRREPSGPVVLVGTGFGAGVVLRYLETARASTAPSPAAVLLVEPRFSIAELALEAPTWSTPVRTKPRRLRTALWLVKGHIPFADRLPVEWPVSDSLRAPFTAGMLAALTAADPWTRLRRIDRPVLVVTSRPPTRGEFPTDDTRRLITMRLAPSTGDDVIDAVRELLAPFTEAAATRALVRATTTVPVLPNR